jgi:2'-5' RNA ligase
MLLLMRIFLTLDIADDVRGRIARFIEGVRGFAPDARWVRPESLHVTLKFIGERAADDVEQIRQAVRGIQADAVEINVRGCGFFPSAKAPRVFWVGIHPNPKLFHLAAAVDEATASIGIAKEEHAFSPHLTLARAVGGSVSPRRRKGNGPNRSFQQLQEKLLAMPALEFGTMTACEFFLYQSQLSPGGSRYTKLSSFALR